MGRGCGRYRPRGGKRKALCVGKSNRHKGLWATRMRTERRGSDCALWVRSQPSQRWGRKNRRTGSDRGTRRPCHHSRRTKMNEIQYSSAIAAPGSTCGAAATGDRATILPNAGAGRYLPSRAGHADTATGAPITRQGRRSCGDSGSRRLGGASPIHERCHRQTWTWELSATVSRSRDACAVIFLQGVSAGAGHRNEVASTTVIASGEASGGSCPHHNVGGQRPFRGVDLGQPADRSAFAAAGCLRHVAGCQPRTAPSPKAARPLSAMGPSCVFRVAASVTRATAYGECPSCSWGRFIVRNAPAATVTPGDNRQPDRSVGFEGDKPSFPPAIRNLLSTPIEKVIV